MEFLEQFVHFEMADLEIPVLPLLPSARMTSVHHHTRFITVRDGTQRLTLPTELLSGMGVGAA